MALEQLKAQIGLLLSEINREPEDLHELYEEIHQKLNELRATGMELPQDLVELEQRLLAEFSGTAAPARHLTGFFVRSLASAVKSRQKPLRRRRGRVAEGNGLLNRHTL